MKNPPTNVIIELNSDMVGEAILGFFMAKLTAAPETPLYRKTFSILEFYNLTESKRRKANRDHACVIY